jgi:hypothetical protein
MELERARAQVQEGIDQLDRGETVDMETFFEEWEAKHRRLAGEGPDAPG